MVTRQLIHIRKYRRNKVIIARTYFVDVFLCDFHKIFGKRELKTTKTVYFYCYSDVPIISIMTPSTFHPFWVFRNKLLYLNSFYKFLSFMASFHTNVIKEKFNWYSPEKVVRKFRIKPFKKFKKGRFLSLRARRFFKNRYNRIISNLRQFKYYGNLKSSLFFPQLFSYRNPSSLRFVKVLKIILNSINFYSSFNKYKRYRTGLLLLKNLILLNQSRFVDFFIKIVKFWFFKNHFGLISIFKLNVPLQKLYHFYLNKKQKKLPFSGFDQLLYYIIIDFFNRYYNYEFKLKFSLVRALFFVITKFISNKFRSIPKLLYTVSVYRHFAKFKDRKLKSKQKSIIRLKNEDFVKKKNYFDRFLSEVFSYNLLNFNGFSNSIMMWKYFWKKYLVVRPKFDKKIYDLNLNFVLSKIRRLYFLSSNRVYFPKYKFKANINFHKIFLNILSKSKVRQIKNYYSELPLPYNTARFRFAKFKMPVIHYVISQWKRTVQINLLDAHRRSLFVSTPNVCVKRISNIMGAHKVFKYIFLRTLPKKKAYTNVFTRSLVARHASNKLFQLFRSKPFIINYIVTCPPRAWEANSFMNNFVPWSPPTPDRSDASLRRFRKKITNKINKLLKFFVTFNYLLFFRKNRKFLLKILFVRFQNLKRFMILCLSYINRIKSNILIKLKFNIKKLHCLLSFFLWSFFRQIVEKKKKISKNSSRKRKYMFKIFRRVRRKHVILFWGLRKGYFKRSRLVYTHTLIYQPKTAHCSPLKLRRKKRK